jgi:hypothetical protein
LRAWDEPAPHARTWIQPATTLILALCLAGFWIYAYLSRLSFNYTLDGLAYAGHVEKPNPLPWVYFHPHHLIYGLLGRVVYLWGLSCGATWDGLAALQFFSVLTGALGAVLAFHLLVRETGNRPVAIAVALGLAASHSYWYFSTIPGVRILATVAPLMAWYVLGFLKGRPATFGFVVGLAHAAAVLAHQTNLLLIPAFLGSILLLQDRRPWERLKASAWYLAALPLGILPAYVAVGNFAYGTHDFPSWLAWVTEYMHASQNWGGYLKASGMQRGGSAFVRAFLPELDPDLAVTGTLNYAAVKFLLSAGAMGFLAVLLANAKQGWASHRQAIWFALAWLLAFVPFFVWWEPWNIEFWVASTVPCWILLGISAHLCGRVWRRDFPRFVFAGLALAGCACMSGLLFATNDLQAGPKNAGEHYEFKTLLSSLSFSLKDADLLVLAGNNNVHYYIDRFQKRRYLNLDSLLARASRRPAADTAAAEGKDAKAALGEPWASLDKAVQDAWKQGHKVFVLSELVDNFLDASDQLEYTYNLPKGSVAAFFRHYSLSKVTLLHRSYFYEVVKPADAQEPKDAAVGQVP